MVITSQFFRRAWSIAAATAAPLDSTTLLTQRTGTSVAPGAAPTMRPSSRLITLLEVAVPWPGDDIDVDSGSVGGPPPRRVSYPDARSRPSSSSRCSATPVSGCPIRIPSPRVPYFCQAVSALTAFAAQRGSSGTSCDDLHRAQMMPPTNSGASRPSSSSPRQPGSTSGTQEFKGELVHQFSRSLEQKTGGLLARNLRELQNKDFGVVAGWQYKK